MPFSIFTTRAREISTRLRLVARGFQLSGIVTWTVTVGWAIITPFLVGSGQPITLYRWMFPPLLTYGLLAGASMFLIGRALLRRQRWGAYLAGVTLGVPLIRQLIFRDTAILSVTGIVVSTAALCAIVTVWDELRTVRDSDLDNPDDDEQTIPARNRGYGDDRLLNEPKPNPISTAARTPEPMRSPRAD